MTNYIIEGTVSELSFDEGYFTICGSEGFSIKKDDKKYNVFHPEKMPEDKSFTALFMGSQKIRYSTSVKHRCILLTSATNEKRIRLSLAKEDLKVSENIEVPLTVASITLLAE